MSEILQNPMIYFNLAIIIIGLYGLYRKINETN